MNETRLADLMLWRDVQLFRRIGSEGAGVRLAARGSIAAVVARSESIPEPTRDEIQWTDLNGEPIDPAHPWWSERPLSTSRAK